MGATNWRYYTPFHPDPAAALQTLRQDVFARGDYVDMTGSMEDQLRAMSGRFGEDPDSPAAQARINDALRLQRAIDTGDVTGLPVAERGFVRRVTWFGRVARLFGASQLPPRSGKPRTIEELLEQAEESGTHSILDIEEISTRPAFGAASPLSPTALSRVFGTNEPIRDQVEEHWADIAEPLQRWHCRYLIVFLGGRPHEYAFIGCSGD